MALDWKFIYLLILILWNWKSYWVVIVLSSSTADPDLGGFPQGWGFKCIIQGLYIFQTGMHAWHFEHIDRRFKVWQPIPTRKCKNCDIHAPEGKSVHGIGIVVLNKWMQNATKSLLGIGVWIHMITRPAGSWLYVSIHHRCVMPFRSQAHAFSL